MLSYNIKKFFRFIKFHYRMFNPILFKIRYQGKRLNDLLTRLSPMAASLSYYTLLSIVPFLAICLAVAKGFELEDGLALILAKALPGQEQILNQFNVFASNLINRLSSSLLATAGIIFVFWSGYRVLYQMEHAFGIILGFSIPRSFARRVWDFLALMLIIPVVIIVAAAMNIYLVHQTVILNTDFIGMHFLKAILYASPIVLWWVIFTWIYGYFSYFLLSKRTIVFGAFVAAICFQIFQAAYVKIMFAITGYNAIYGSFAAIPLFMIWQYTSWLIVLGGVELARAVQDQGRGGCYHDDMWWGLIKILSLSALKVIITNYQNQNPSKAGPTSIKQLSLALNLSTAQIRKLAGYLLKVNLIVELYYKGRLSLMPTHNLTEMSIAEIIAVFENGPPQFTQLIMENFPPLVTDMKYFLSPEMQANLNHMTLLDIKLKNNDIFKN